MPPDYVLDRMPFHEIGVAIEGLYRKNKDGWEQARLMIWTFVRMNSKSHYRPKDIIKFPWDNILPQERGESTLSQQDIKRLRKKTKEIEKLKN
jgi:hypothetical protein